MTLLFDNHHALSDRKCMVGCVFFCSPFNNNVNIDIKYNNDDKIRNENNVKYVIIEMKMMIIEIITMMIIKIIIMIINHYDQLSSK